MYSYRLVWFVDMCENETSVFLFWMAQTKYTQISKK